MSKQLDTRAIELIDLLIRKSRDSQYLDTCSGMHGCSSDWSKAEAATDAQEETRTLLLNHLNLEDS